MTVVLLVIALVFAVLIAGYVLALIAVGVLRAVTSIVVVPSPPSPDAGVGHAAPAAAPTAEALPATAEVRRPERAPTGGSPLRTT